MTPAEIKAYRALITLADRLLVLTQEEREGLKRYVWMHKLDPHRQVLITQVLEVLG